MAKKIIVINALALVVLAAAFFVSRAEFLKLERGYEELRVMREQIETLNELRLGLTKTEAARRVLDDYFVRIDNLAAFIERIEGLATTTEVSLTFTKAGVKRSDENLPQADFIFTASGGFVSLSRFLFLLEAMPLELHLRQSILTYQPPTVKGIRGMWKGQFILEVAGLPENYGQ